MAKDRSRDRLKTGQQVEKPGRREALKKAGKLAYTAPVLTVIQLTTDANAQLPSIPPPPGSPQYYQLK
jgi:hypothetical protein